MNGQYGGQRNSAFHQNGGNSGQDAPTSVPRFGMGSNMQNSGPTLNAINQMLDSYNAESNEAKLKQKVCVHWLKNNCRKNDKCEFLHVYIEDKIPICKFFKERGHCDQQETCVYRHPTQKDPGTSKKQEPCPYYERGFCKLGAQCNYGHGHEEDFQKVCLNYALGFCPDGPKCRFTHVKSMISLQHLSLQKLANFPPEENFMDV